MTTMRAAASASRLTALLTSAEQCNCWRCSIADMSWSTNLNSMWPCHQSQLYVTLSPISALCDPVTNLSSSSSHPHCVNQQCTIPIEKSEMYTPVPSNGFNGLSNTEEEVQYPMCNMPWYSLIPWLLNKLQTLDVCADLGYPPRYKTWTSIWHISSEMMLLFYPILFHLSGVWLPTILYVNLPPLLHLNCVPLSCVCP